MCPSYRRYHCPVLPFHWSWRVQKPMFETCCPNVLKLCSKFIQFLILWSDSLSGLFASICSGGTLAIELYSPHLLTFLYSFCLFITLSFFWVHINQTLKPGFSETSKTCILQESKQEEWNGTVTCYISTRFIFLSPDKPSSVHFSCWILNSEILEYIETFVKF